MKLCAEWLEQMGAYRLYDQNKYLETVAYVKELEEVEPLLIMEEL